MPNGRFAKFGITERSTLINIALVMNALVWYFCALTTLEGIMRAMGAGTSEMFLLWSSHFLGVILSALTMSALTKKIHDRFGFLAIWIVSGIVSPVALLLVNVSDILSVLTLSILLGISFGFGMPSCMGQFTVSTSVENRGRAGGIIMFLSGVGIFLLGTFAANGIVVQTLTLMFWRLIGLTIFLSTRKTQNLIHGNTAASSWEFLRERPFVLYLVPWVMFSLVNDLSLPVQLSTLGVSLSESLTIIESGLTGIFAVIGGFLSDFSGRKRVAMIGFVMLGLGYAILGVSPGNLSSWYFYTVVDGVALGFFFVIFVVTIWGDLSGSKLSDKCYAVGLLPFFVSKFVQTALASYIAENVSSYAIFSFTALFLFVAILPLMYAPETLPEKKLKERELKGYIEKARKTKEKYT